MSSNIRMVHYKSSRISFKSERKENSFHSNDKLLGTCLLTPFYPRRYIHTHTHLQVLRRDLENITYECITIILLNHFCSPFPLDDGRILKFFYKFCHRLVHGYFHTLYGSLFYYDKEIFYTDIFTKNDFFLVVQQNRISLLVSCVEL